ncbi:uncharacterized protein LOC141859734 [Acropora palmata]|uniref:uncharacterized protein LOC141859734 n=1 Tax=Acropora palmata TaxID=6131 RepID=UPI003DA01312
MASRSNVLRGLALTQMVFGGIMFLLGVASAIFVRHWSSYVGFGIWVGVWAVITGILGYLGARDERTPNKCLIGCYMGFSINASVIAFVMFICYCIAVDEFSRIIRCYNLNYPSRYYDSYNYRYSSCYYYWYSYSFYKLNKHTASIGAGLGGCLLVCAVVETVIALTASIYCCNAVCCGATTSPSVATNQQVMFVQAGQAYPGGQTVVIQPGGAIATGPAPVSQPVLYTPQQLTASGMPLGGSAPLAYPGTTMVIPGTVQHPGTAQTVPPPYTLTQAGNAAPTTVATGDDATKNSQGIVAL